MTRQEGIREKIFAILVDSQRLSLKECGETTDKILEGISKLGAALKVERELPENPHGEMGYPIVDGVVRPYIRYMDSYEAYKDSQQDMLEAGCGFFESLIEEGK